MLRKPQLRLVITFHTTAEALKTEKLAREQGLEGRLIPVPQVLSAGCGLAWSAPPETQAAMETVLERGDIQPQQIIQLTI